jgi:deoxyribodipyrimidine photo-lyase
MPPILLAVDKAYPKGLMWFRRDLRVDDNAALYHALRSCRQVLCVFVFDRAIRRNRGAGPRTRSTGRVRESRR